MKPRRGAYLLPSLLTTGNMLLGFYAVVLGLRSHFEFAVLLVFAAAVLDSLDGAIARMTNTESDFGREYDSLADLFTFGATPALLAYLWGLDELGRAGWLLPLFFMVSMAIRLARYNVQPKSADSRFFAGLPAPAAAGAICSIVFFQPDPDLRPWIHGLMVIALPLVAGLMISTFRYRSIKRLSLRQRRSYRLLWLPAAALLLVAYHPPAFFLTAAVAYTLSGPIGWLYGRAKHRGRGEPAADAVDPSATVAATPASDSEENR
jgi:CDP-diacylglycerol--serine O-phosphatidyltransferase